MERKAIKFHHSIVTRLTAMNVLIFIAVSAIVILTLYSFQNIKQGMKTVIGSEVSQIIKNGELSRELSGIFADTNMLIGTFAENSEFLEKEGSRLIAQLEHHRDAVEQQTGELPEMLQQYHDALLALLQQCGLVNEALRNIRGTDAAFKKILAELDKVMAERMLDGDEGELATLDHLGAMLPGYHEVLFEVIILVNTMTQTHLGVDVVERNYERQILDLLDELKANLEVLNISGRHFVSFGEQLTKATQEYRTRITAHDQALRIFQERLRTLKTSQEQVKTAMGKIDADTATAAADIQNNIDRNIQASVTFILILSAGIFLILLLTGYFSFRMLRPIKGLADMAHQLARGNLSGEIRIGHSQDEIGQLQRTMGHMMQTIQAVLNETNTLIQAVREGKLDTHGQAEAFEGSWQELVGGLNHLIAAFMAPLNVTAEYLDCLAKGEIPVKITEVYHGDFNEIKNNLNTLIDVTNATVRITEEIAGGNLNVDVQERSKEDRLMHALNRMIQRLKAILQETDMLTQTIQSGNLSVRGTPEGFEGGWYDMVQGINALIEAFVKPIDVTARYIDRIANGDIPDKIAEEYQGDFNTIKNNLNALIEATNEITRLAEEMAEGNLLIEVHERSAQDTLMQALNTMIQHLKEAFITVRSGADSVTTGSNDLSSTAEELSQGTAQQAAATEEASASMEEMVANISQNADNAQQTGKIALQSTEYAQKTGEVVAKTVTAMKQIAKEISVIQDIAGQIRMLSLNATIEAVRAQDYGKAFSVVAAEVRNLSSTTNSAAEEIAELTHASLEIAENAGEMLGKLLPDIHKTAELVQEISAASAEQNSGAAQINRALQQLDQVTQQNAAMAEQLSSMAEELTAQARQLQRAIRFFKIAEETEASDHEELPVPQPVLPKTGETKKKKSGRTKQVQPHFEYAFEDDRSDRRIPKVETDERDEEFERF